MITMIRARIRELIEVGDFGSGGKRDSRAEIDIGAGDNECVTLCSPSRLDIGYSNTSRAGGVWMFLYVHMVEGRPTVALAPEI